MKKIISSLLIVMVLFNFILCNDVYVTDAFEGTSSIKEDSVTPESQEKLVNEGQSSLGAVVWDILGAIFGTIAGILALVINLFPMLIQGCMTIIAGSDEFFTIEQAVFNEVGTFNINFFNFKNAYTIGTGAYKKTIDLTDTIVHSVKPTIAKFFVILRLIAIAISLLILIYVGIRMVLSTISSDKAKYKKMLLGWFESVILLFVMQYIISLMLSLGEMFGNIIYDIRYILDANGEMGFEDSIIETMTSWMLGNSGWNYVANSIPYWFLVFLQTKFFIFYFKRVVTVGFLILIAPLITITYPIDKIGDGKAQAFSVWFNELSMNIFIQPIHALIYLVFMYSAGEIAKYSIFVALLFLLALTKVEKMILYLFNLKNVTSLKPVDEENKK